MDNIKIAFIDLDGTLTNSNKKVSENNLEALNILKNKNIKIVITTGRWDTYIYELMDKSLIDYIITNNGSCVIDVFNNKVIYEDYIEDNNLIIIDDYCKSNNIEITYNGLFKRYKDLKDIKTKIYQGVIICKSINEMDKLIEFTNSTDKFKISYISYPYYKKIIKNTYTANINNKSVNKGNSINYLLNYLNINKEDSMCFGDNDNDIEMFNNCGIKIAMENSIDILKNNADYVTLDNDKDGIFYFIKNHF